MLNVGMGRSDRSQNFNWLRFTGPRNLPDCLVPGFMMMIIGRLNEIANNFAKIICVFIKQDVFMARFVYKAK